MGLEEEKENDFELRKKFDEMEENNYDDDYDDQVLIKKYCFCLRFFIRFCLLLFLLLLLLL